MAFTISRSTARLHAAVALVAVAALAGCAAPSGPAGAGSSSAAAHAEAPCAASGTPLDHTPLDELEIDTPATELTGPSTACLVDAGITVIDSDIAPQLPVTVTDHEGMAVTVTDVSRILALDVSGTLAATVFGLGLGGNVVGRDASTGFPEAAALPVVTRSGHVLAAEPILGLDPSVILTDGTLGPTDVLQQLRDSGIPIVITNPEHRIETIDDTIREVAAALGVPARGDALSARVSAELEDVTSRIQAIAPDAAQRPRILFLYMRGSASVYYLFGAESGADSLITAVGGIDVATEMGWQGMRPVTAEALIVAQPDIVLLMTGGLESVHGVDGLLERIPALESTPAGEKRRFIDMADSDILGYGPRTPAVLDALARAIYAPHAARTKDSVNE